MYNTNLKTNLYTFGKFGKSLYEIIDPSTLYDRGKMKAKIKAEQLSPDFCKIHCKSIWYMDGFIKISTIRHIAYEPSFLNHILKDDCLYISYERSIKKETENDRSFYKDYDFILSGSDIIRVLNSIDTYGTQNIKAELQKVRAGVNKKIEWFKENYPEDYYRIFQTRDSIDIFKCDQFK